MIASVRKSRKAHGLFSLAVLLLLLGGAALLLEPHSFVIRSLGLLAILGSVQLVRMSRVPAADRLPANGEWIDPTGPKGPSRPMWLVGFGLLALAGLSLWLLYLDGLHGAHALWPVYLFAAVGLACAGVWGAILANLRN